jgi:hypothetical protein
MMFLVLFLVFAGTAAALWFQGLFTTAITIINMTIAGLVATNFFEPTCNFIEGFDGSFTYLLDFVVWWILFGVTFAILRAITDLISDRPVKFIQPVELAGRSVLAIWGGWLMVCLVAFSLAMAPIDSETPLGAWAEPDAGSFLGFSPEQQWAGFAQSRSQGALSRANFSTHVHPDDVERNCEAFDPFSEFFFRYHARRAKYAAADSMRVAR